MIGIVLMSFMILLMLVFTRFHAQADDPVLRDQLAYLADIGQSLPTGTPTNTPTPIPTQENLPDLDITSWRVTYFVCPWGSPGFVSLGIKNIGTKKAGQFSAEVNHVISCVTGLKPQVSITVTEELSKSPIGGVDGKADIYGEVKEINESNNLLSVIFTAPPPCPGTNGD